MITHQVHPVTHPSHVGKTRRWISRLFKGLASETFISNVSIICNELGGNLVRHTDHGGQILLKKLVQDTSNGMELISIDNGPGMSELEHMLEDGRSSNGSSGIGLGAVRRLSHEFDAFSRPETGSVFVSRIWDRLPHKLPVESLIGLRVGVISIPKPGLTVSGDEWCIRSIKAITRFMVVDGTGHGHVARIGAREALLAFQQSPFIPLDLLFERIHQKLSHTLGASMTLAEVDLNRKHLQIGCIGNVTARLMGAGMDFQCPSPSGIIGGGMSKVEFSEYDWCADSQLIIHSDGIRYFSPKIGQMNTDPCLTSSVLIRDFFRGNDDATVMVVKNGSR